MMSSNVNILITAQNRASGTFRQVTSEMDALGSSGNRLNSALGTVKGVLGTGLKVAGGFGLVAGGVLAAGLSKAVSAGSDANEMMSAFNVVFAKTNQDVAGKLDVFSAAVGRSKYELRGMAMQFGDTLKPMGFTEEKAADLSVDLVKLATDLGSFKNMPAQEAFERLQGTLIGNHENALAFGVIINENTLKAELARMGADRLTGAMLEQAKVQARINLLVAGTTDAQGDAARTADGWANQQRRLASILTDTGTAIGMKVLPVLTPFLTYLGDLATQYAPQAIEAMESMAVKAVAFLERFKSTFAEAGGGFSGFLAGIGAADFSVEGTAKITDVLWGLWTHTYDSKTEVTEDSVLWGAWTHMYNAEAEITEDNVLWGTWTYRYDAKAEIAEDGMFWGLFSHTYDAKATVNESNVGWGFWEHTYDAKAQVTNDSVLWGVWTFTYDAKAKVNTQEDVLWGLYSNTYNVKAQVSDALDVAWGAYSYTYDAKAQVLTEESVAWGSWSYNYDVGAKIGEKRVLWGAFTTTYDATGNITKFTILGFTPDQWGELFTIPFTAEGEQPEWIASLQAWQWPMFPLQEQWLVTLMGWAWPKVETQPGWISTLVGWAWPKVEVQPGWIGILMGWAWPALFDAPGWLTSLMNWAWPVLHLPEMPAWVGWLMGGGANAAAPASVTPQGHAMGTSYTRGGLTWVGERGPELVNLPSGARVHNAVDSRRMADGGAVGGASITNHIYVQNDIDVEALLFKLEDMQRRRR